MERSDLLQALQALEPSAVVLEKADRAAVSIPPACLVSFMTKVSQTPALSFDFLLAHTAVHRTVEKKFELLYQLFSTRHSHYCLISTEIDEATALIHSVSALWRIAEWQEREVYDLFGVRYEGHPDLRRILLDDDWKGFPLRKDYKDDFMLERA